MFQQGWSAIHIVAWNGYSDVCALLLTTPGLDVNLPGGTPDDQQPGNTSTLASNTSGSTISTISSGSTTSVGGSSGTSELSTSGSSGTTALHLASQRGHEDVVRQLLADTTSPRSCDVIRGAVIGEHSGVTALHLAAHNGHAAICRLLLSAAAASNCKTAAVNASMTARRRGIGGLTPLHLAVEADHMDVMDVLIEAGCDVQSTTQGSEETVC